MNTIEENLRDILREWQDATTSSDPEELRQAGDNLATAARALLDKTTNTEPIDAPDFLTEEMQRRRASHFGKMALTRFIEPGSSFLTPNRQQDFLEK